MAFSQNTEYSGIVYGDGYPVVGATILVKDSTINTKTDFDGKFTINVPDEFNVLIFSYAGYETINYNLSENTSLSIEMSTYQERGIWMSIGTFSDITFAPYGISISNGQDEQNLLHFESFQESISVKLALATNFDDNLTYETRLSYHRPLLKNSFYNTSIEYLKKEYSELELMDISLTTDVIDLPFINSLLTTKVGIQDFKEQQSFGAAIGLKRWHHNSNLQYGAQIGYWNDYFTYNFHFRKFIYKDIFSLVAKYNRIDDADFFVAGVHFLFKTNKQKY
ncbi:carboxypeptidase-like regulatory domain-containing protein [Winogradskyella forsetii]|uniref:carboxypeptidase-like regulatory domain-containing protein n=1 Tax=Winogradskyella forsetii TaxID=2686077 RepID=UPI0015C09A52|nr:carboxypeptidase-like regulatory domain-containing protein [Winogradskyella forsetii]